MSDKKYAFASVDRIEIDLPQFVEVINKRWVTYGDDNLFPDFIIKLFNQSAINRTCILSKTDALIGQGLSFENEADNYLLKRANPTESWNDILEKISLDLVMFGGFALNVIFSNDGKTIAELYHLDFSKVRSGIINPDTDKVESYFYCSDWTNTRKIKPQEYVTYNKAKGKESPSQILYYYNYQAGAQYYPLPDYVGAVNDIQIDIEVSKFHISNLGNGLNPGLIISMNNGVPQTDSERAEIYDDIVSSFKGTHNAGRLMLLYNVDKDSAAEITTVDPANDDYYITLDERITSRILSAHRITSPKLLGIYDSAEGFSSNADEIEVAYMHFLATVIKPMQKGVLKVFNQLLYDKGITDKELRIIPNRLVSAPAPTNAIE